MDKKCNKCNIDKYILDFHKDKTKKDGYKNFCKLCQKKYSTKYYIDNKDKVIEYSLSRYIKMSNDIDYKTSRSKYILDYNKINKDKKKEYNRKYNINNRESIKKQKNDNKEQINKKRRETKSSNNLIRLRNNIRTSIYASIIRRGYTKRSGTSKILGIEYDIFIKYIESKFESWMNWDNYGRYNGELNYEWDLDHIIPSSSAKTEDELINLNHYSNFQPLCSKVNRDIKKDKIIYG